MKRFALAVALLLASACADGGTQPGRVASRIDLDQTRVEVDDGGTVRLIATVRDQRGDAFSTLPAGVSLTWSSSDPEVASVAAGLVGGQRPGEARITARAGDLSAEARVTVRPVARQIELAGGSGQQGDAGAPLPQPLVVRVVDRHGNAVGGVAVQWTVRGGGGSLTPASTATDAAGYARATWTLGSAAGAQSAEAAAAGLSGSPVAFTATAVQGPSAATRAATAVNASSAALNGEANANGSATAAGFEWGTSSTLAGAASTAQQSIGAGTSVVSVSATLGGLAAGTRYYYRIVASSGAGRSAGEILNFVTDAPPPATAVRIVTFGDSNTDYGYSGSDPTVRASSYISRTPEVRLGPSDPNSPLQLAGKIEARWKAARPASAITAVNHGIGGTSTTSSRHFTTAPNARTATNGVTRFAAEVLGVGYPWSGGESVNQYFPEGAITRVRAFTPGPSDFAYLSIGTNDPSSGVSTSGTISNLTSMVDQWIASGRAANHLIVTTLAPRNGSNDATFPQINDAIRALGSSKGIHVIDLAAYTSNDNGLNWKSASLHVGDEIHYSEAVRDWLAEQVVAHMTARVP